MNHSGVDGEARLALADRHLTVRIDARGLEPSRIHEQAIHGQARSSRCPGSRGGAGGRVLSAREAADRFWGRVLTTVEPFPTVGRNGELHYGLTVVVDRSRLDPLEGRVLVLKGTAVSGVRGRGGRYFSNRPVACGRILDV